MCIESLSALQQKSLAERRTTLEVIELLQEVERRSLHLQRGYGSLLEFCMKELKYSESAAYRRICAMRVMKDIPQVKKSKREAEKILLQKSPSLPQPELVRQISETQVRVTLNLEENLVRQLDRLKNQYSHSNPNPSYAELIELMARDLLQKRKRHQATPPVEICNNLPSSHKRSRYISLSLRNYIFKRDNHCCTYVDPSTKKKCNSMFQLEVDHIKPFSLGGKNEASNLRLVCRNHNQFHWKFSQSNSRP